MKLKDLIKLFDPLGMIKIYGNDNFDEEDPEPLYEGVILNIPWWIVERPIAKEVDGEEPVHTWYHKSVNGYIEGLLILTVDLKEEESENPLWF